jgi:hypothetical protein
MLGDPGRVLLLVMLVLLFVGLCAYVWGRLALVSAIIADRSEANPLTAIRESMALTTGNGWRLFGFLFLVTLVVVIAVMMVSGGFVALESMSGMSGGPGSVRLLSGFAEAVVGALGGLVTTAVTTAAYRQLAAPERGDVFS